MSKSNNVVTPERIENLMKRVSVHVQYTETPVQLVTAIAYLDNSFLLAIAPSKAADPANFNKDIGTEKATARALAMAKEKLYELEGYLQYQKVHQNP